MTSSCSLLLIHYFLNKIIFTKTRMKSPPASLIPALMEFCILSPHHLYWEECNQPSWQEDKALEPLMPFIWLGKVRIWDSYGSEPGTSPLKGNNSCSWWCWLRRKRPTKTHYFIFFKGRENSHNQCHGISKWFSVKGILFKYMHI